MEQEIESRVGRREFFSYLTVAWASFAAAAGGLLALVFRFTYPNVNFEPEMDFLAGKPGEYDEEGVYEKYKNKYGVWIVRLEGKLFALDVTCTHLGCVPSWLAGELKFKCPCHGSGYYMNGVNFEGPAPRPLERFKIGFNEQGVIKIDKTKRFRAEKGEWDNPSSFIPV